MKSFLIILAGCLLNAPLARAHAFVDHAQPAVGGVVHASPVEIKVWFTENLAGKLCKLQVMNAEGREVDKRDKRVDSQNGALLLVSVPLLQPGKYTVIWKAVSVDKHITSGTFAFEVKPRGHR